MKKTKFNVFPIAIVFAMFLSGCGGGGGGVTPEPSISEEPKLDPVTNINYEDGILSYSEVSGATGYELNMKHKDEVVFSDTVTVTSIDVESLDLGGKIDLSIRAVSGKDFSAISTYSFVVYKVFDEVLIEAENNLYNFGTGKSQSNFRNNPLAHGGAYVGGLDDAGHGIYINYLCPAAGEFDIESHYCFHKTTEMNQAHHDVFVNGVKQTEFLYTVDTGWGGATFTPEVSKTKITLVKGWNTISIMKNGDSSDNWGDFAEIDYVLITGNGIEYNPDDLDSYGEIPPVYKLEAEMGSPRKKQENNLYMCKNPCIADANCSNGFIMGGVEAKYDGVEWHFDSPVKAKYEIQIAYAAGIFDGSKKARPTFIVTQEAVLLNKNIDFEDYEQQQMEALDYTGWNTPKLANQKITLELDQGDNFIYCLKLDGSGFFQIDYCNLTFISEIVD